MKNKTLILGLVAFVFAIGSAFTTAEDLPLESAYIWIKATSGSPDYVCTDSQKDCNAPGGSPCVIRVTYTMGSGGTKNVNGHPQSDCSATLTNGNDTPQDYETVVFDAVSLP